MLTDIMFLTKCCCHDFFSPKPQSDVLKPKRKQTLAVGHMTKTKDTQLYLFVYIKCQYFLNGKIFDIMLLKTTESS